LSDIHIVFRGGTGTISEFGMAWAASRIRTGQERPIILFGEFWRTLIENFRRYMYMRPGEFRLYKIVESANEAVNEVKRLVGSDKEMIIAKDAFRILDVAGRAKIEKTNEKELPHE
jgi:predicted Rossmann-fold nucleotide-binding protein